jgi:hypothetical protein
MTLKFRKLEQLFSKARCAPKPTLLDRLDRPAEQAYLKATSVGYPQERRHDKVAKEGDLSVLRQAHCFDIV